MQEIEALVQNKHSRHFCKSYLDLSVVLPLRNKAAVVDHMYRRLTAAIAALGLRYELVFVDDGSRDGTADRLARIAHDDPNVAVIVLARHFGKEAALSAGFAQASGQAVVIMDADLRHPPECIPSMLAAWRKGADVVLMRRRERADGGVLRHLGSRGIQRILDAISDAGMPESSLDFMLYSQDAMNALGLVVDRKRYMQSIFGWINAKQVIIEYEGPSAATGASKPSLLSVLGLRPDGNSTHIDVMSRIAMLLGLTGALGSILYASCTAMAMLVTPAHSTDGLSLAPSCQVLSWSFVLFLSGGLVKYISHALLLPERPRYAVKQFIRSRMPSSLSFRREKT